LIAVAAIAANPHFLYTEREHKNMRTMAMQATLTNKERSILQTIDTTHDRGIMAWVVVLSASLYFFYEFIQMNVFASIDVQLMQAFHLDAPELGRLASLYFYANAVFVFPAGVLLDRYSPKRLLLIAVILSTLGTLAFALATEYWVAAVSRFIVGTGAAFCFLGCIRIASRWFPPKKMAFVTGMAVTIAMTGGLVAQTPFALLTDWMGWRHAMLWDAGLGIIIFFAIYYLVQDRPPNSQNEINADINCLQTLGFWRSISLVITNRYNWLCGLYTSLMNLPVFLLGALWGIHYLVEVRQLSIVHASYATTLFFVGVMLGAPAFGWLSDRIGRRIIPMIAGAILSLVVILILMTAPHLALMQLIVLFFLIGFTTSSQVLSYPVIAELNPIALTGSAVSIDSITIMIGGVVFQPLFGYFMEWNWDHKVVDGVHIYAASDFSYAMFILPIAFVISLVISFFIKETYCKSQV
jgi:MFS family permease